MTSRDAIISGETNNRPSLNFIQRIENISERKKSPLILALDFPFRARGGDLLSDAKRIIEETSEFFCAIKLNLHILLPLSLDELGDLNGFAESHDLVSIADLKLNDIDNTNLVASRYLWSCGFSAVIVNPFVGYEGGLDLLFGEALTRRKGVIALVYMSHKAADEGYGLKLEDGRFFFEALIERAKKWNVCGAIVGATRAEIITKVRSSLPKEIKIFSPGHGAQRGDAIASLKAGSDFLIYGRSIVETDDPRTSAKTIYESVLAWKEKR